MNILYISRENAPGDHGGAVHTWQVASLLSRSGHHVKLLCHRLPTEPRLESRDGVEIHRANLALLGRSIPIRGLPALGRLWPGDFDVVMERFDVFGGLGAIYNRARGTPLLLEVNYPHLEELVSKWRLRRFRRLFMNPLIFGLRAWSLWQYSRASAIIATRASIVPVEHRHKIDLVHWGADTDLFRPAWETGETKEELKRRLKLGDGPVVVSHGSFQPWHGVESMPDIIARVVAREDDVLFLILGRSRGLDRMSKRLQDLGLSSHCRFVGKVAHDQIPEYLRAADLALAPFDSSAYPPLLDFGFFWSPAKVFEYMACGVPLVTTDQDYLRQVIEGSAAGHCFPQGDAEALAKGVLHLLSQPGLRQEMGRAGRRAALERFSWQVHVEQLETILQNIRSKAGFA